MGARLAAHCANSGIEATLLDRSGELATKGLEAAVRGRPAAFFLPEIARRVKTGSFGEGEAALGQADWVVEAIVEDLEAKHALLAELADWIGPGAAVSTNTSGLRVREVGAKLPERMRPRWLGTHFFNPPRYMHLVEIIPTAETDAALAAWLAAELDLRLGKGIVAARDTPNFIANRIGLFALMNTLRLMEAMSLSVEEVDALTGPMLGWPTSATFRTLDLIGLDTLAHVVRNSHAQLTDDEHRELFRLPGWIEALVARGWLGEKTGQGVYQRRGDEIWAVDPKTLEYHPKQKIRLGYSSIPEARRGNPFVAEALEGLFGYCERRLGEITDDRDAMDRAMRWGYNWQWGPFELREKAETRKAPIRPLGTVRRSNPGSALLDLGDGIGCLTFRTKMNVIGGDTVRMVQDTLAGAEEFDAFVIGNSGENFSAGADLLYLLALIQNEEWDEVAAAVHAFQGMNMAIKRSTRPVVAAPFGMALGGGCEMLLHCASIVTHAELYAGLVELGVGLIPAGGGTKEMALRMDAKTAFETIGLAKVSTSAAEATGLRLLRRGDEVIANRDRLVQAAARRARQLADAGYTPPAEAEMTAPGPSVASTLKLGVYQMREAEYISDHDLLLANRLIDVLCARGAPAGMKIPESKMLEYERETFLSLCSEPKTQERIAHMLKTGKALRN